VSHEKRAMPVTGCMACAQEIKEKAKICAHCGTLQKELPQSAQPNCPDVSSEWMEIECKRLEEAVTAFSGREKTGLVAGFTLAFAVRGGSHFRWQTLAKMSGFITGDVEEYVNSINLKLKKLPPTPYDLLTVFSDMALDLLDDNCRQAINQARDFYEIACPFPDGFVVGELENDNSKFFMGALATIACSAKLRTMSQQVARFVPFTLFDTTDGAYAAVYLPLMESG
jgi:hypothetical protein